MVLMAVGEDDAEQVVALLLDEVEVGQDQLDAGIVGIGEGQAEIDHQPFALAAVEIDVHADLARAAEREEEEFFAGMSSLEPSPPSSYEQAKPLDGQVGLDGVEDVGVLVEQGGEAAGGDRP